MTMTTVERRGYQTRKILVSRSGEARSITRMNAASEMTTVAKLSVRELRGLLWELHTRHEKGELE